MISYETYKILHLFTLFMVISAIGAIVSEGKWIPKKSFRIAVGIFSFLVFVGGMGLIARLGFRHGEPFPAWIIIKIVCWVVLNVAIVGLFRFQDRSIKMLCAMLSVIAVLIAIVSAVTKFL